MCEKYYTLSNAAGDAGEIHDVEPPERGIAAEHRVDLDGKHPVAIPILPPMLKSKAKRIDGRDRINIHG